MKWEKLTRKQVGRFRWWSYFSGLEEKDMEIGERERREIGDCVCSHDTSLRWWWIDDESFHAVWTKQHQGKATNSVWINNKSITIDSRAINIKYKFDWFRKTKTRLNPKIEKNLSKETKADLWSWQPGYQRESLEQRATN